MPGHRDRVVLDPRERGRRPRESVRLDGHRTDDLSPLVHGNTGEVGERGRLVIDPFPQLRMKGHGRRIPGDGIFLLEVRAGGP